MNAPTQLGQLLCMAALLQCCQGCVTSRSATIRNDSLAASSPATVKLSSRNSPTAASSGAVQLASHQPAVVASPAITPIPSTDSESVKPAATIAESLEDLELFAIGNNPVLRRMEQEAAAEWAKTGYVSKLPDPSLASMFYLPPMNFTPDRQVAEIQVMQMLPWLARLNAEAQRAHFEAMVAENQYQAERLRLVSEVRMTWFRLYVLRQQIATTETELSQLESLAKTANARVATGHAQPGDVLMATLEMSSLQEQLLSWRQQMISGQAELNRLLGRDARTPIIAPQSLSVELPDWNHELLTSVAMNSQPELNAARLRTAATRWGIEVARLKRRPDVTVSGGWIPMDSPGALMPGAGRDSWTLGVATSLPIWNRKYDAMVNEASRVHCAAHASEEEIVVKLDATLRDLWEQARAAQQTIALYETTILPQARQAYEADQKSLANNAVAFDRVVRSYRTLLNLELSYHRAIGQLAITVARIRQTVGVDLMPMG